MLPEEINRLVDAMTIMERHRLFDTQQIGAMTTGLYRKMLENHIRALFLSPENAMESALDQLHRTASDPHILASLDQSEKAGFIIKAHNGLLQRTCLAASPQTTRLLTDALCSLACNRTILQSLQPAQQTVLVRNSINRLAHILHHTGHEATAEDTATKISAMLDNTVINEMLADTGLNAVRESGRQALATYQQNRYRHNLQGMLDTDGNGLHHAATAHTAQSGYKLN